MSRRHGVLADFSLTYFGECERTRCFDRLFKKSVPQKILFYENFYHVVTYSICANMVCHRFMLLKSNILHLLYCITLCESRVKKIDPAPYHFSLCMKHQGWTPRHVRLFHTQGSVWNDISFLGENSIGLYLLVPKYYLILMKLWRLI